VSQSSTIIQNGNYILQNGQLLNNNSLITEIYMAVVAPLGTYLYDPTLGSELLAYLNTGNITRTGIIDIVNNALQPLIVAGRIAQNPQIVITFFVVNKVAFTINAVDSTGEPIIFNWQNYGSN
jgi:phage gp46-like protein